MKTNKINLKQRWEKAQIGETRCWEKNSEKILTKSYQTNKIKYWERVINKLVPKKELKNKNILDFGCGPSGLVIYLRKYNITCLDPLMDLYTNIFPYLKKIKSNYINGQIEDFSTNKKFDFIFGFNSIDHVEDINRSLLQLKKNLAKNGQLIITLNCHNYSLIQKILFRYSSILDKLHPHQYLINQYMEIIEKAGFKVNKMVNLDNETEWINIKTKSKNLKKLTIKDKLNPGKIFFSFIEKIFGIKRYGSSKEKRIYSHVAFICSIK